VVRGCPIMAARDREGNNLEAPDDTGDTAACRCREALHQGMVVPGTRPGGGTWSTRRQALGSGTAPIAEQAVMAQTLEAAGSTYSKKRRMNSVAGRAITLTALLPDNRASGSGPAVLQGDETLITDAMRWL